jgi:hypothetical protein
MSRGKQWAESLRLPLAEGTISTIDTMRHKGEKRVDFIRDAIEREILRRSSLYATQAIRNGPH